MVVGSCTLNFFFLEADFRCIIYIYIYRERERERERGVAGREQMQEFGVGVGDWAVGFLL